ncbi:unnamed protein product [Ectocarpus sp. CCAP 1310/34]|nr:unnamed protein product [Ectocarpus sp. CCAP 1310/34]
MGTKKGRQMGTKKGRQKGTKEERLNKETEGEKEETWAVTHPRRVGRRISMRWTGGLA